MELLTSRQVAKLLAIGHSTVYKLTATGKLPAVKLGRSVRYRLADVHRLIESSTLPAVQPG